MNSHMKSYMGQGLEGSKNRSFCLQEVGVNHSMVHGCAHQPGSSLILSLQLFLWRLHYIGRTINLFYSSSSLSRGWGSGLKVQALIMVWSFQWPSPNQEPNGSCLFKTEDTLSYHPENTKRFRSSVLDTPITQEITRILRALHTKNNMSGALCQEPGSKTNSSRKRGQKTVYIFPIISVWK